MLAWRSTLQFIQKQPMLNTSQTQSICDDARSLSFSINHREQFEGHKFEKREYGPAFSLMKSNLDAESQQSSGSASIDRNQQCVSHGQVYTVIKVSKRQKLCVLCIQGMPETVERQSMRDAGQRRLIEIRYKMRNLNSLVNSETITEFIGEHWKMNRSSMQQSFQRIGGNVHCEKEFILNNLPDDELLKFTRMMQKRHRKQESNWPPFDPSWDRSQKEIENALSVGNDREVLRAYNKLQKKYDDLQEHQCWDSGKESQKLGNVKKQIESKQLKWMERIKSKLDSTLNLLFFDLFGSQRPKCKEESRSDWPSQHIGSPNNKTYYDQYLEEKISENPEVMPKLILGEQGSDLNNKFNFDLPQQSRHPLLDSSKLKTFCTYEKIPYLANQPIDASHYELQSFQDNINESRSQWVINTRMKTRATSDPGRKPKDFTGLK